MASVNKVILVGNLGRDPEMRYTAEGSAVCNIAIATTSSWKDKGTGDKREEVEWHRVSLFGRLGEVAGQYLKRGSAVYIEGRIKTNKYQKDGVDTYSTSIIADSMQLLGVRGSEDASGQEAPSASAAPRPLPSANPPSRQQAATRPAPAARAPVDELDDIPF